MVYLLFTSSLKHIFLLLKTDLLFF